MDDDLDVPHITRAQPGQPNPYLPINREKTSPFSMVNRIALYVGILALASAWFFRWDVVPVPAGGQSSIPAAYMVNRITGNVKFLMKWDQSTVENAK